MIDTDRIRQDGYWDIQCAECRAWFGGERSTATFCSSTCRSRNARREGQRQRRIERAMLALTDLIEHLPQHGESVEFSALQRLATLTTRAIESVETV